MTPDELDIALDRLKDRKDLSPWEDSVINALRQRRKRFGGAMVLLPWQIEIVTRLVGKV